MEWIKAILNLQDLAHFPSQDDKKASELQWLPSDVAVDLDGSAHFTSYINNLHPYKQKGMYGVLEEILTSVFVPMWSRLLTGLRKSGQTRNGGDQVPAKKKAKLAEGVLPPVELKGRRIQVIVRMATTLLTPGDNSKHSGQVL